ncbi:MAG: DUF2797 domain-containing protein [Methylococcales bacterium]|jgi:Protein of unknown function (DUF2797).|nr:DUF2797 domain-containing protein [Methylococcales bacterium]
MLGQLRKMIVDLGETVGYQLPLTDERVNLNALIGRSIVLRHTGKIFCVHCGRQTKKSFNQGHCYPCFISLARCDMCIMKPEQCHFDQGTCREPEWGKAFCMQSHFVYLAKTSGVKVGITRGSQIPTRWIDQGAVQALPIFKVKSRHLSGLIEVILAKHVKDRTNWQRMLKNQVGDEDLLVVRDQLVLDCREELAALVASYDQEAIEYLVAETVVDIHFPVTAYPEKVKSFNLDKQAEVSGKLEGIKGQYLILDTGVINIRKFSGYEVEWEG